MTLINPLTLNDFVNDKYLKNYVINVKNKLINLSPLMKNILNDKNLEMHEILLKELQLDKFNSQILSAHFSWWWKNFNIRLLSKNKTLVNEWYTYIAWFLGIENHETYTTNGKAVINHSIHYKKDTNMINEIPFKKLDYGLYLGTNEDPWLTDFINSINAKQPIPPYPLDIINIKKVKENELSYINKSLELLAENVPQILQDVLLYVELIVPIDCKYISNFTDRGFNRTIFIGESVKKFDDIYYTAEHILHEAAHIKLNFILNEEPLITAPKDYLVDSPFRADKRPLEGLLHAVFVYKHILLFWESLLKNEINIHEARERVDKVKTLLMNGLRELNKHQMFFTKKGNQMLDELGQNI